MAEVEQKADLSYEIVREGEDTILKVDAEDVGYVPSIEDNPYVMARTHDMLIENATATKIVFTQKQDYEYDYAQTRLLVEIARLYNQLSKQKQAFSYGGLTAGPRFSKTAAQKFNELQQVIFGLLKKDPLGCFVELKRIWRREKILFEKQQTKDKQTERYLHLIEYVLKLLEHTELIQSAEKYLAGYKIGDRTLYRRFFNPSIKPDFMFTKLMANYPRNATERANYEVNGTEVSLFELPDTVQSLYHIMPPEFKLPEDKYELLDLARKIMAEHKPEKQEFVDPERMREVFYNVGHDLIEDLAIHKQLRLKPSEINELARILVRYTVGFGLIEVLLEDPRIQDITINSPMGKIPMFLVHQDFDECKTNIIPTIKDAESWATKLRLMSGRPLDEANPILDTDISIPGTANARVSVITRPINPSGLAYAFRRHRDRPWTLPLFIQNKMLDPLSAGLMSFLIDGNRTMLVAGTRSAGKTSLLGAMLTEIMRKYRIITVEDTMELPTTGLRNMGYNIQPLKVASALTRGSSEVSAEEGIRTTLRMGDSALIVGEIRSAEATALYEAMRVGALANVVAGTIHGDSPYGVFDRVVNDLKVPRTSFKATDVIVVANPIKSADGLQRWRRVTQITEVRKLWEDDPLQEHGFVDIMKYNAKTDTLEPSDDLINGDIEVIKSIAGNVKEWAGDWDAVWNNILLRAKIKETLVKTATTLKNPEMLEAGFVIQSNDEFHKISDKVQEESGSLDSKRIFSRWSEWLRLSAKKMA